MFTNEVSNFTTSGNVELFLSFFKKEVIGFELSNTAVISVFSFVIVLLKKKSIFSLPLLIYLIKSQSFYDT